MPDSGIFPQIRVSTIPRRILLSSGPSWNIILDGYFLVRAHPEIADFWMEPSAISGQQSAKSLFLMYLTDS